MRPEAQLGQFLDRLQRNYHRPDLLSSDPLEFVHRYKDPWDQETVALVSALLAYGNVKQIRRSLEDAFRRMSSVSSSPAEFVRGLGNPDQLKRASHAMKGFTHRFNRGPDLILLFRLLAQSWRRYGSLGSHFLTHLEMGHSSIETALSLFIADWRAWALEIGGKNLGSFDYLLTSPADGSCCKRWCMFLRWMGRKDELDPGLWTAGSPLLQKGKGLSSDLLVIPLDTHTGRISQYLGLTQRKTLDWKAAREVTTNLARYRAQDPTCYDFAISRLGILDLCQRKYREEICNRCELVTVCKFARAKSRQRAKVKS